MLAAKKNYLIEDLTRIPPIDCPCGQARKLTGEFQAEGSNVVKARVLQARARQRARFKSLAIKTNGEMYRKHMAYL